MARRDAIPDFIEAPARGLDVIRALQPHQPVMSLTARAVPQPAGRGAAAHGMPGGPDPRVLVHRPAGRPGPDERAAELRGVRARCWSLTDEQLAAGIRSVAALLRDGDGRVIAALNVTVHAAETPLETLTGTYPPLLLQTAGAISADWARYQPAPHVTAPQPGALTAAMAASRLQVAGQVSGQRTSG